MTQELLRLHDAKVKMDGRVILDVDDFVINQGEHIVVLGPNGSGKSTLVKLLTKEIEPVWRETPPVLFMGQPDPSEETLIETVRASYPPTCRSSMRVHRTVFDIVPRRLLRKCRRALPHRQPPTHQVDRLRKAIREIGIPSLSERDMLTLSTGQARRALIARALINGPALLIFDEPTLGLDPEGAWNMRQSLSALAKAGHTVLVITHNVGDIMPEFERVVMLQDAHIVADGPKEEVLTTQKLRHLFGVPITLVEMDGRYHLQ